MANIDKVTLNGTDYKLIDSTVPSWAKASTKPSYTASEVGAVPTTRTVNGKALNNNITLSASDVGADVFVVNIERDDNDVYTCDKTNAEIYAAWQAGRNIVLIKSDDSLYKLNEKPNQTYCEFSGDDYDDLGGYRHYTIFTRDGQQNVTERYIYLQEYLQSGTNIKTINNLSLLGSGNLTASDIGALPSSTHIPADQVQSNWNETNTSSKAYIQNKPSLTIEIVTNSSSGSVTQAMDANKFYKFTGSPTSITITLNSALGLGVYGGKFTANANGTTLVLPSSVTVASSAPSIEGGNTYEFNIADNVLLMVEV